MLLTQDQERIQLPTAAKLKYCCEQENCTKTYSRKTRLRQHILKVHLQQFQQYFCNICNKPFIDKEYLKSHQRVHTGEKPYGCSYCDAKFSSHGNKHDHERRHLHIKRFVCEVCNKAYYRRYQLQNHSLKHLEKPKEESKDEAIVGTKVNEGIAKSKASKRIQKSKKKKSGKKSKIGKIAYIQDLAKIRTPTIDDQVEFAPEEEAAQVLSQELQIDKDSTGNNSYIQSVITPHDVTVFSHHLDRLTSIPGLVDIFNPSPRNNSENEYSFTQFFKSKRACSFDSHSHHENECEFL